MNAATVHSELELCKLDGAVIPELVVERAQDSESPLHSRFTWDDGEAAHQYRLIEARNLIRVHVLHIDGNDKPIQAYVSLTSDRVKPGGGYRAMQDVMNDDLAYEQMLRDALTYLHGAQAKYSKIKELDAVWGEVEKVEADITEQQSQLGVAV